MHTTVDNLKLIENEYKDKKFSNIPQIIAVSKTFPIDKILPLIDYGHDYVYAYAHACDHGYCMRMFMCMIACLAYYCYHVYYQ